MAGFTNIPEEHRAEGESSPAQRSGIRRRRCTGWRDEPRQPRPSQWSSPISCLVHVRSSIIRPELMTTLQMPSPARYAGRTRGAPTAGDHARDTGSTIECPKIPVPPAVGTPELRQDGRLAKCDVQCRAAHEPCFRQRGGRRRTAAGELPVGRGARRRWASPSLNQALRISVQL